MTGDEITQIRDVERAFRLDDLHVRQDGGGRIVEAYAAVFDQPTEVMDQDGHYNETIDRGAFTRTLQHKGLNFGVLFNHGRTIDGAPYPAASMPIGVPLEIKTDDTGVWTATRYLDNPLADWALDAITQGAIKSQSFSGRFRRSMRSWPEGRGQSARALISRKEVEMREYGPAVFAAYTGAAILGTRSQVLPALPGFEPSAVSQMFARSLMSLPPQEVAQWLQQFETVTTPAGDTEPLDGTPTGRADHTGTDTRKHSDPKTAIRERITAYRAKLSQE